jgi:hypothetical protein
MSMMSQAHVSNLVYLLDSAEMGYFKTMLLYHAGNILTSETNRYAYQVISKYDKDDFITLYCSILLHITY